MLNFSIEFLGTGNAWSKPPANFNNSIYITIGSHSLLVDCGTLGPLSIKTKGLSLDDIDDIFISHLHGDHVYGIEELALYNYFIAKKKTTLWLPENLFTIYSGLDGEDLWHNCLRASLETTIDCEDGTQKKLQLDDYFNIKTLKTNHTYSFYNLPIEIFPVQHAPYKPFFGLILDNRVAYTSDTIFDLDMLDFLLKRNIECIFHDVSFAPFHQSIIHATFEQLKTLPKSIAQKIVLMHYDDSLSQDSIDEAHKHAFTFAQRSKIYNF